MSVEIFVYVIAIVVLVVYLYNTLYHANLVYVLSKSGKPYLVQNKDDKNEAANLLEKVTARLSTLIKKLNEKYPDDNRIKLLTTRFKPENIRESVHKKGQTSYSINKGEKIVLCLRMKNNNNKLVDINTIMFVALHELAHVMTVSIGHQPEFWENFRFLLAHSAHWDLYDMVNYSKNPQPYCGISITENPLRLEDKPKYISF